jgi:hypothetical protein
MAGYMGEPYGKKYRRLLALEKFPFNLSINIKSASKGGFLFAPNEVLYIWILQR